MKALYNNIILYLQKAQKEIYKLFLTLDHLIEII